MPIVPFDPVVILLKAVPLPIAPLKFNVLLVTGCKDKAFAPSIAPPTVKVPEVVVIVLVPLLKLIAPPIEAVPVPLNVPPFKVTALLPTETPLIFKVAVLATAALLVPRPLALEIFNVPALTLVAVL